MQARFGRHIVSIWDSALKPRFEEAREVVYRSSLDKVTLHAGEVGWWESEKLALPPSACVQCYLFMTSL